MTETAPEKVDQDPARPQTRPVTIAPGPMKQFSTSDVRSMRAPLPTKAMGGASAAAPVQRMTTSRGGRTEPCDTASSAFISSR